MSRVINFTNVYFRKTVESIRRCSIVDFLGATRRRRRPPSEKQEGEPSSFPVPLIFIYRDRFRSYLSHISSDLELRMDDPVSLSLHTAKPGLIRSAYKLRYFCRVPRSCSSCKTITWLVALDREGDERGKWRPEKDGQRRRCSTMTNLKNN